LQKKGLRLEDAIGNRRAPKATTQNGIPICPTGVFAGRRLVT
jgi:hypothetical protein